MAFFVVNATTIPVAQDSVRATFDHVGDRGRTFDGTLRETIRSRLRNWTGETKPLDRATATAVRAAFHSSTQPQTCSGDLVSSSGGSLSMFTRVEEERYMQSGSTHAIVLRWIAEQSS